jgi:hypothetical protein
MADPVETAALSSMGHTWLRPGSKEKNGGSNPILILRPFAKMNCRNDRVRKLQIQGMTKERMNIRD